MKNGRIIKLKERGKKQLFKFRIMNLEEIRIHFNTNKGTKGKFPIIKVSPTGVEFGRHISAGYFHRLRIIRHKFNPGSHHDFFFFTDGTRVVFGEVVEGSLNVVGFYQFYEKLDSLPFIGFSSTAATDWILEDGESGGKIRLSERKLFRSLQLTCQTGPGQPSPEWVSAPGLDGGEISSILISQFIIGPFSAWKPCDF